MSKPRLTMLKSRLQVLNTSRVNRLPPTYSPSQKPSQQPDYRIRGRKGQRIRAAWLRVHPLCCACESRGEVTIAREVDHRVPLWKGGADDESNYQSLCIPDHRLKSEREAIERAKG